MYYLIGAALLLPLVIDAFSASIVRHDHAVTSLRCATTMQTSLSSSSEARYQKMIQKREALNEARFATIYQALETFKSLNGHVNVKQRFVVPLSGPESEAWPVALRGFKLGNALCSIRKGAYATHRSSLEAIGYP